MVTDEPPAATSATELSPIETAKLENLEIVIENGIKSFLAVGRALLQIRDERLYRLTHTTFEAYSQERWNMSRSYASRMADAAASVDLLPIGDIQPANESQVRPLAKLPVEERGAAWQEAVEASSGKPTAAIVEKIVERRKAPQAKAKAVEAAGNDDELLDEVAGMLNSSVAAMNKSKAVEACPNCGGTDWDSDDLGRFCSTCKDSEVAEPAVPIKRLGKGVDLANEAINALSRIPKNDKLRGRAWEIVRDWLNDNEGASK